MSDENDQGPKLKVLEFNHSKERKATEANKVVSDMFKQLADRAAAGDIEDFVITFKSESRGIESMIGAGGGVSNFDFVGYVGMLEVLKQRLLGIMSQMTYSYAFDGDEDEQTEGPTDEKPEKPENPETE